MRLAWWLASVLAACAAAESKLPQYRADGTTTYCRVSPEGLSYYSFWGLEPKTMSKCPLLISMKVMLQSVSEKTTAFNVTWTVSLNLNKSGVLYPADVEDGNVKLISPYIQACPADSDCEDKKTMVTAAQILSHNPIDLEIGQRGGQLTLASYRFDLSPKGEYVFVGNVGVMSDSIDQVDTIVLQRVQTSTNGSMLPGVIPADPTQAPDNLMVRPTPTTATPTPTGSLERVVSTLPVPSASQAGSKDATAQNSGSGNSSSGSELTALVLASVAVVALALIALFFVQRRRKQNSQKPTKATDLITSLDSNDMYQLTDKGQIDATSPVPPLHNRPASKPQPYINESGDTELMGTNNDFSASGFSSFSTIRDDTTQFVIREDSLASYKIPVGQLRTDTVRDDPMTLSEMMASTKNREHDRTMTLSEMMVTGERKKSHKSRSKSRRRKDRQSQSIVTNDEDTVWL